jgi:hypothetical protein
MTASASVDLTGAHAKLERGREHVDALLAAAREFLVTEPYSIEVVERSGQRIFVLRCREDPPGRLATVAGDAVHNLRSALDLAICALVTRNRERITKSTGFPVVDLATDLTRACRSRLRGAGAATLDAVQKLKPYRDGNLPLWQLHRLDIEDKHKLLATVGMAYRSFSFDAGKMMGKRFPDFGEVPSMPIALRPADQQFPLRDGAELFSEPVGELSMEPTFNFELSLGAEEVKGEPVSELLPPLITAVEDALNNLAAC